MRACAKPPELRMSPSELAELKWLVHWYERQCRERRVMCDGKHKFDTFTAAAQTIRPGSARRETEPYKCKVCQFWHVGSARSTRERRLKFFNRKQRNQP